MSKETIDVNIRIDKNIKEQADNILSELGMNIAMAVNIFLIQTVKQGKFPIFKQDDFIKPASVISQEEKSDLSLLRISDIDEMLGGSVVESLIGILPYSDMTTKDYRLERLKKYGHID